MLAIVDYGVGNLFSLQSSVRAVGAQVEVVRDPARLSQADRIILPGVGAFGDAVEKLRSSGMFDAVLAEARAGKPLLGICLGMQLLFARSFEYGVHEGLGLIAGEVRPIAPCLPNDLDVPHMGWNGLVFPKDRPRCALFADLREGDAVYFVHSYAGFDCAEHLAAQTEYGSMLTAAVQNGNVYGTQFHPEKSGAVGLAILKRFCAL